MGMTGATDSPLLELFRSDVAQGGARIEQHLSALGAGGTTAAASLLEAVAREAQVITAAARILGIEPAFRLARSLGRAAAAGTRSGLAPGTEIVDGMFGATTVLARIAAASAHIDGWMAKYGHLVDEVEAVLSAVADRTEVGLAVAPAGVMTHQSAPLPGEVGPLMALLRLEIESHGAVLSDGLLALERNAAKGRAARDPEALDALMRAAHSIKGAAHAARHDPVLRVAAELEARFTSVREGQTALDGDTVDALLELVDQLRELAAVSETELPAWIEAHAAAPGGELAGAPVALARSPGGAVTPPAAGATAVAATGERVVRIAADHLDRIMALAGETVVDSGWLDPFASALATLRRRQLELAELLDQSSELVVVGAERERLAEMLHAARGKIRECQESLVDRLTDLRSFSHQSASLSASLYNEVIGSRMRPFADGITELPRLVRDLSRQLGKEVQLDVAGGTTRVDRDVLDKLAAPLAHLVRNAIDHGLESSDERTARGKPATGSLRVEARHRAGRLAIVVADDGRGVNFAAVRRRIADHGLAPADRAAQMPEAELIDYLFQPGFSTAPEVSDISGRGVGLDVVRDVVRQLGGKLRAEPQAGRGMTFQLELPVTRSVLRTLLVEIGGEAFAFPLVRVERVLLIAASRVASLEGRQYLDVEGKNIGLIAAHQVLELSPGDARDEICVVVISDQLDTYGLVVDRFLGERDLVVQPLDPRLGKINDLAAASIMQDGTPVVILNVDDLVRSVNALLAGSRLQPVHRLREPTRKKRVLVIDDSNTVREALRRALDHRGYAVDLAADGVDGWTAARTGDYALVVTDIDLPRLSGHDLIARMRAEPRLADTPIIIISYKDREEDRRAGLAAGADRYLDKTSFHDDQLISAVAELIGAPGSQP